MKNKVQSNRVDDIDHDINEGTFVVEVNHSCLYKYEKKSVHS